jgi:peptide deformylase
MILPIYVYGSDVLRAKAEPMDIATVNKEELQKLVADMFETMYNAEGVDLQLLRLAKVSDCWLSMAMRLRRLILILKDSKG